MTAATKINAIVSYARICPPFSAPSPETQSLIRSQIRAIDRRGDGLRAPHATGGAAAPAPGLRLLGSQPELVQRRGRTLVARQTSDGND